MNNYENTLRQYQQQIDNLKRQNKKQIKELQRRYEEELDRLQKQMMQSQKQELRKLEKQYQSMMDEYKRHMRGEITELNRQYREIIDRNNREIQRYQKLIEDIKQKVEKEIQRIQQDIKNKDIKKKNLALQQLQVFETKINEVKELPHQKFQPDKLEMIEELKKQIESLMNQEFYEAAIAVAQNGVLRLKILEYEVNSDIEAYTYAYEQLESSADRLKELANNYENNWKSLVDINYWSFGKYGEMKERLADQCTFIDDVKVKTMNAYLMNSESLSMEQVNEFNHQVVEDLTGFISLTSKTTDNYNKYKQRELIVNEVCDDLKSNYRYIKGKTTYEEIEYPDNQAKDYIDYMQSSHNQDNQSIDYRGWIKKTMKDVNKNIVIVYVVPEDIGGRYLNRIILHVKSKEAIPKRYILDLYKIIQDRHLNNLQNNNQIEDFVLQVIQDPDDTADLYNSHDKRITNFALTLSQLYFRR